MFPKLNFAQVLFDVWLNHKERGLRSNEDFMTYLVTWRLGKLSFKFGHYSFQFYFDRFDEVFPELLTSTVRNEIKPVPRSKIPTNGFFLVHFVVLSSARNASHNHFIW